MSNVIDPTSDRPAYRQIADHLRAAIVGGRLGAGEQLPSERALMETYRAARGTVRQAIATLRAEGLVDIEHGRGAFVRRRPPVQRKAYDRFARRHRDAGKAAYTVEMEEEGRRPEVQVLEVTPAPAPPEVARLLQVPEGSQVLVRRHRYLADGQPMEVATSYLPWELVQGTKIAEPNTGPGGIYARLEELGHRLKRFTEDVRARMALPEETRALQLPPRRPGHRPGACRLRPPGHAGGGVRHGDGGRPLRPVLRAARALTCPNALGGATCRSLGLDV